jgi:hypothetical protein
MASQKENPITVEKKEYQDIEQYCARSHFVRDDMARRRTPAEQYYHRTTFSLLTTFSLFDF